MKTGRWEREIINRQTMIRLDFERRYPDGEVLRARLFDIQDGLCPVCEESLDGIEGIQMDRNVQTVTFAESSLSISEACAQANAESNLILLHQDCYLKNVVHRVRYTVLREQRI